MKKIKKIKELNNIYGVGLSTISKSFTYLGFKNNLDKIKFIKLTNVDLKNQINFLKSNYLIDQFLFDLKKKQKKQQVKIYSYKTMRLSLNLPLRGQRTKTNSKTAKKMNNLR